MMAISIQTCGAPEKLGQPQCHASTLLALKGTDWLCAWFAGTEEGNPDTAIWLSQRRQGIWSPPQVVAKVTPDPHWNPVLFRDGPTAYLFFKVGASPRSWRTYWMHSPLDPLDWSPPQELVPGDVGGRGPVKNKPLRLGDGDWLAPASSETETAWDCFVDRSSDRGLSWQRSPSIPLNRDNFSGRGLIQPTLWESAPGRVHLLCRTTAGKIYRSDSADGGRHWGPAYPTSLPNNNSGIDLLRLEGGTLVLAYNPQGKNWGPRTPLVLAASADNGCTWEELLVLERGPGEYSYPAIAASESGFAVSYTWCRQHVCFREFQC